mmetsp:Transcript_83455/g.131856  ORF Transcript_83455/g.131856 Transcript_83455/m.131856 type:complete len:188 (+) Transcript_83455:96-659(+)
MLEAETPSVATQCAMKPSLCDRSTSVHCWLAVEFRVVGREYAIVAVPDFRVGALPSRSEASTSCILMSVQQNLMGRFGLPSVLHKRRIAWIVEDHNGVHEQFQLPPEWAPLSHDEVLATFESVLSKAHARDTSLRSSDDLMALLFVQLGLPASLGIGWLRPTSCRLPEPLQEVFPVDRCDFCIDEDF